MIGATLSHADAAGRHWQFIVVGAGPGGSATALRLFARRHATPAAPYCTHSGCRTARHA